MFRTSLLGALFLCLGLAATSGCKDEPDPRDHPDFNHESASDPGSIVNDMTPLKSQRR